MNIKHLILVSALIGASNSHANARTLNSIGEVVDVKSGELIYREHHTFNKDPDNEFMQTEYRAINGDVIATRRVDFSGGFAQSYTFKQFEPKIEKVVTRTVDEISYRGIEGDKIIEKNFSPNDNRTPIVNAGMFNAVEREWTNLLNNETVKLDLVAPERGRTFTMLLKKADIADSNMAKHADIDGKVLFKLTIANRLFRLLLKPIELGYDLETKRLVYYQGPSNIHQTDGKKFGDIRVIYDNH